MTGEIIEGRFTPDERRAARELLPYLKRAGWVESRLIGSSIDGQGAPIPWLTYPAIAFLEGRVREDMTVFEFGSGNSTRWWAQRVSMVIAVEHDPDWAERVSGHLPVNASVTHVSLDRGGAYSTSAQRTGREFHIVVVDGRDRVNCAIAAASTLRSDGVMIFDNSERRRYASAFAHLELLGFRRVAFAGLAPVGVAPTETSVLYRDANCLGL